MGLKRNNGSWVEAIKIRRLSNASTASLSSPRSPTFSIFSRSSTHSRTTSLYSVVKPPAEEEENLMVDEPKTAAYVPSHAANSFMKTATSKSIRKNGTVL